MPSSEDPPRFVPEAGQAPSPRRAAIEKGTMFSQVKLTVILFGLAQLVKFAAWRYPQFRARAKEHGLTAQFVARDEAIGRWFKFENGTITSGSGVLQDADVTVGFKNATAGASLGSMPAVEFPLICSAVSGFSSYEISVVSPREIFR